MPDIVTRGTLAGELSYQQGDEQIAETQIELTTTPVLLDETYNREHVICGAGSDVVNFTAPATLTAALDTVQTSGEVIGWVVKISNNSGSDVTLNNTGVQFNGGTAALTLADNDSVIVSLDTVSTTNGYFVAGEFQQTVPVARGGTGATTLTDGGVLLGSGTGAITATAVLADGEMLVGDGTTDPAIESGATLRTSIGVGTGDSPQFTGIELGDATDTTITRSAAGIIAVENNKVPTYTTLGTAAASEAVTTDGSGNVAMASGDITGVGDLGINQHAYFDAEVDAGTATATLSINWTSGNKQKITLGTSNVTTVTFTAPSGPASLTLKIVQHASSPKTVTGWDSASPDEVFWPGGSAPTITATSSAVDIITFYYDGTDYYGAATQNFS